jgi:hypothetical protein
MWKVLSMGCAIFTLVLLVSPANAETKKKLIAYGNDWPNTAYVRAHIQEIEHRPFDGVVIAVTKERAPQIKGSAVGFQIWGKKRFELADYQHAIDDLKSTKFNKFTDNFIQAESMPAEADWFSDEDFAAVAHNFNMLAKIAHDGGCKGIEFDPEEYAELKLWSWTIWPEAEKKKHKYPRAVEKARQRGREIMQAINSEFPDIKMLCLFGPSGSLRGVEDQGGAYYLLSPFYEGMCEVATPGTQLIDGYELSYGHLKQEQFEYGRKRQLVDARKLFRNKDDFDRCVRAGFGLWMDCKWTQYGWDPNHPEQNYFTPETWQTAVYYALKYSDEYVWVWHEKYNLWTGENLNPVYLDAQEKGRTAPSTRPTGRAEATSHPRRP